MFFDPDAEGGNVSNTELELLRLGSLRSATLESNPIFMQMRAKTVSFFKLLEKQKDNPEIRIDNKNLKRTLFDSLKKLLRVIILNEDKTLQVKQLLQLYKWFESKSNALETNESALALR